MTHDSRVLVAYATGAGSTAQIAAAIARRLKDVGFSVDLRCVVENPIPSEYSAIVLGSAVHGRAWLPAAEDYVRRKATTLATVPVWMFSVGLGPALHGPIGRRIAAATPPRIEALRLLIAPRDYRSFAGVFPKSGQSLSARVIYYAIGGRHYGDLRDWTAIESWAESIGQQLSERHGAPQQR